jgi:hypothetical protein
MARGLKNHVAVPMAALVLGLLFAAPVPGGIGTIGFISPAMAQPATLTKRQSDALKAYNDAVRNFEAVLTQRRAQLEAKQPLPNLPGQALYLARNAMLGAAKDLTDAVPSRIGGPNKFNIPPAYFDAANEPLLDEYVKLFALMQAPPAGAQKSETPFKDVVDLGTAIARAKGSMRRLPKRRAASASGCSLPKPTATRTSAMPARTNTRVVFKPARPKTRTAAGNGLPSRGRSPPSIPA